MLERPAPSSPNMAPPPPQSHSASPLLALLSFGVLFWVLMGTLSYADDAVIDPDYRPALLLFPICFQIAFLVFAAVEAARISPGRGGARVAAACAGFGAASTFAYLTSGWANGCRRTFWSFGGIWAGLLVEATTGVFTYGLAVFESFMARR